MKISPLVVVIIALQSMSSAIAFPPAPRSNVDGTSKNVLLIQAPNTEHRLKNLIENLQSDSPDMNQFEPFLKIAIQQNLQKIRTYLTTMGATRDIAFVGSQNGGDVYQVTFEKGVSAWWIIIAPNGKIAAFFFQ